MLRLRGVALRDGDGPIGRVGPTRRALPPFSVPFVEQLRRFARRWCANACIAFGNGAANRRFFHHPGEG
jgi:hypothetical protein